jgi:excisionase family DNA binding protein
MNGLILPTSYDPVTDPPPVDPPRRVRCAPDVVFHPRRNLSQVGPHVDTEHCDMDPQLYPIKSSNPLITGMEACEYLRISDRQLFSWRGQGLIPYLKIGRSVRYRLRDLDEAMDALTIRHSVEATKSIPNPSQPQ